jgi:hypothetical protein
VSDALADWPAAVNLLLASLGNGVVVGAVAVAVSLLVRRLQV